MNLDTTVKLLEATGANDPHKEILCIMKENSIVLQQTHKPPIHYQILEQYQLVAFDEHFIVQGLKLNLLDTLDLLIRRGVGKADALRSLALALDLEKKVK